MTKEHERFLRWFEHTDNKMVAKELREHWEKGLRYTIFLNLRNKRKDFTRLNEMMEAKYVQLKNIK